jgi:hypothetical protein
MRATEANSAYRLPSMHDNRYLSALATVLRGSALPYGYTLTIWTSGLMLTRERGLPSVGEIFLFMVGAFAGFVLLGLIVSLTGAVALEPSYGVLRRTGMIQLIAVTGALGGATLVAQIHSGVAWPVGAFVATAAYLALATFDLTLAESH